MPVGALATIGDFTKAHSFKHAPDRALLTSPKYVEKIKAAFSKTPFLFDLYFVNKPGAGQHVEIGQVRPDFVFSKLTPKSRDWNSERSSQGLGIDPRELTLNPEAITCFFTNNAGAERMPMTAWIIAHRLGHVISRAYAPAGKIGTYAGMEKYVERKLVELAACYGINKPANSYHYTPSDYASTRKNELAMKYLCHEIGTMRSARDKNLRNLQEMHHELFAQYLVEGQIILNPAPARIPVTYAWGKPQYRSCRNPAEAQNIVEMLAASYHNFADNVLNECVGKIFVM